VSLVDIAGSREIRGGNSVCSGQVDALRSNKATVLTTLAERGFLHEEEQKDEDETKKQRVDGHEIKRDLYSKMFGPTTGT
jgi:hypothetical protein